MASSDPTSPSSQGAQLSTAIVLFHTAVAEAVGLNLTDYKCLELLLRKPITSPGRLSAETGLSTATTTLVLDRLASKGLVERTPDPSDRRKVVLRVTMTAEFADRFRSATNEMVAGMDQLLASFSARDRAVIDRYIDGATTVLERSVQSLRGKHA